jgi:hypothetical protein
MQTRFAAGAAGAYLQALRDNYDVQAAIVPSANLKLPGAGGSATRFAYARPVPDPSVSPSASPGRASPPGGPSASVQPTPEVSP